MGDVVMNLKDNRVGLGPRGLRIPRDEDMNTGMTYQLKSYWYNLMRPLEDYPTER